METSKFSQLFHYWSRFSVWSNFSKQIKHQNLKNFENLQSQTIRRKCWHIWISFIPSILVTGCFVIFLLHNDYLNYYPFCLMVDFLPTDVHKNFSQALIILGTIHMMIIIIGQWSLSLSSFFLDMNVLIVFSFQCFFFNE